MAAGRESRLIAMAEFVKKGDKVKVDYTGTFDDGTVFDSSQGKSPLEFSAGFGQVIKGFDDAVIGMKKGDEKTIKIPAKDAYGEHHAEYIKELPKQGVPADIKEGMMLVFTNEQGMKIPAVLKKIGTSTLTVDFNHPLAGKTLNFKIKVVEISH